jgi:hypothetical protein
MSDDKEEAWRRARDAMVARLVSKGPPREGKPWPPVRGGNVNIEPLLDTVIAAGFDPYSIDLAEELICLGIRLVSMCHKEIDDEYLRAGVDYAVQFELNQRADAQAALEREFQKRSAESPSDEK